jgi:hypothetical protein
MPGDTVECICIALLILAAADALILVYLAWRDR